MRKRAIASLATVALLLSACGGDTGPASDAGNGSGTETEATKDSDGDTPEELRLAAVFPNNSFDSSQLQTGNLMQYWLPIYDTLVFLDTEGLLQPNLATEWEYDESRTALSITLRDDVTFTDGEAFDGEAVKLNMEYFRDGTGSNSSMLATVEEIEVVDATHVVVHMTEPDPGFTNYLSTVAGAMASPAILGDETAATNPVGSGPYVFDSAASVSGASYVFARNADYWNPEAFPYEKITITAMEEVTARLNALRSGEIDGALLDAKSASEAEGAGLVLNIHRLDWQGLIIADRDGSKDEPLGDVRVRQAINHAFNRDAFVENVLLGHGIASTQIFNDMSLAYSDGLNARYPYDIEKAKSLLEDAGYPNGFTITMPQSPMFAALNDLVEQQLSDIGISVEWDKVVAEQYVPSVQSGDYGIFLMQLSSGNEWRDVYKSLTPEGPWNPRSSTTPEMAAFISAAEASATDDEFVDVLLQMNTHVVDEAWMAPIHFADTIYVTRDEVSVTPQPQNVVPAIRNYR